MSIEERVLKIFDQKNIITTENFFLSLFLSLCNNKRIDNLRLLKKKIFIMHCLRREVPWYLKFS